MWISRWVNKMPSEDFKIGNLSVYIILSLSSILLNKNAAFNFARFSFGKCVRNLELILGWWVLGWLIIIDYLSFNMSHSVWLIGFLPFYTGTWRQRSQVLFRKITLKVSKSLRFSHLIIQPRDGVAYTTVWLKIYSLTCDYFWLTLPLTHFLDLLSYTDMAMRFTFTIKQIKVLLFQQGWRIGDSGRPWTVWT